METPSYLGIIKNVSAVHTECETLQNTTKCAYLKDTILCPGPASIMVRTYRTRAIPESPLVCPAIKILISSLERNLVRLIR
jgi:hypothetical protein